MSSRTLFVANLLIQQPLIPYQLYYILMTIVFCIWDFLNIIYRLRTIPISQPSIIKSLRFKTILEIGIAFL